MNISETFDKIGNLWDRLIAAIEGEATTIEKTLTELEQKLMPKFDALLKQIEKTIGAQGVEILEQGAIAILTVVENGGNVGAAIAELVPAVMTTVKEDLKQDASNAAHTVLGLLLAPATDIPKEPVNESAPEAENNEATVVS